MEFKDLSNRELVVINIIREVEDRRLHLELGYGSLFEYVIKELGYDESAANRRITAARLTRQIPTIDLTLLCHRHNIFKAIKDYGLKKMESYVQSSTHKT